MMKKSFLLIASCLLYAKTDFNINLTIPPAGSLPQYKTATNMPINNTDSFTQKTDNGINQSSKKTQNKIDKLQIKKNIIDTGNVKIISGNVIDKLKSNPYQNICEAFIADNSNNAFDYGYKEGVKYTEIYIGKFLLKHKKALDILFPLKQLYLDGGILQPPLIGEEDKGSYIYKDGDVYRQYGVKYYIKSPARFVTENSYKKWEDFLLDYPAEYYKNIKLDNVLKFKMDVKYSDSQQCNLKIRDAVYKQFREGFKSGEKDVFLLMSTRLKKLQKFVNGLYLYNELYYRGIINPPLISEFIEPVYENNDGKSLIINEKVLKIVKPASFNTETKKWKTFLITNDKITTIHLKIKN